MVRRIAIMAVAVCLIAGFSLAGDTMEAKGKVKAVSGKTLTVTDEDGKDHEFMASSDTKVTAEGASHKVADLEAEGKPAGISDFVREGQRVTVKYTEKEGKLYLTELHVH